MFIKNTTSRILPSTTLAAVPDLVRRLGMIMVGLAAVVAMRFLRMPRQGETTVAVWGRLQNLARRFAAAVRRGAIARVKARARPVVVRPVAVQPVAVRRVGVRLPQGRGWLVRALGYEAVAYQSQLAALLAEPEMQAVLAAVPGAGRVLRPICQMLGVAAEMTTPGVPAVKRVRKPRPPKVRMPRFSWKRAWAVVENRPWPADFLGVERPRSG